MSWEPQRSPVSRSVSIEVITRPLQMLTYTSPCFADRCTYHLPDPIEPLTDVLLQYDCALCHQHFVDTQQMNEGYLDEQRTKEERTQQRKRKDPRKCLVCAKVCKSAAGLEQHMLVKHPVSEVPTPPGRTRQETGPKRNLHCPERQMVAASVISPTNENVPPHFIAYDPHRGSLGGLARHVAKLSPVCLKEVSGRSTILGFILAVMLICNVARSEMIIRCDPT